jgi:hypothetical protein
MVALGFLLSRRLALGGQRKTVRTA